VFIFYTSKLIKKVPLFTDPSSLSFSGQPMQNTSALDTFFEG